MTEIDWPFKTAKIGKYNVYTSQNPYERRPVVVITCMKCVHKCHYPFLRGFSDEFLRQQSNGFGGTGGSYMRCGALTFECKSNVVGMSFERVCELIKEHPELDT